MFVLQLGSESTVQGIMVEPARIDPNLVYLGGDLLDFFIALMRINYACNFVKTMVQISCFDLRHKIQHISVSYGLQ